MARIPVPGAAGASSRTPAANKAAVAAAATVPVPPPAAAAAAAAAVTSSWQPQQRRSPLTPAGATAAGCTAGSAAVGSTHSSWQLLPLHQQQQHNKQRQLQEQQQRQPGRRRGHSRLAAYNGSSSEAGDARERGREGMPEENQMIKVKCMLAEGSGRLDLSECELTEVPPVACELQGLEDLSLAGNQLSALPPAISRLTSLARLQLAGNQLQSLPDGICEMKALEGLWLHGNLLESLPAGVGQLAALTQLSLSGNRLASLPADLAGLQALQELSAAGNLLEGLPDSLGALGSLKKLSLHGNRLRELPPASLSGLSSLQELGVQGNPGLSTLPDVLGTLPALRDVSAADCGLTSLPASLGSAPALESLSLYGNQLTEVPPEILQAPRLKALWLEGNPLTPDTVAALLAALPHSPLSALGLDESQVAAVPPQLLAAAEAGGKLRLSRTTPGAGPGYFKLDPAPAAASASAAAGNGIGSGIGSGGSGSGSGAEVLVVSFGSAPGTPNWGGLLKKVRAAAEDPEEQAFDVLYVVDPHRAWYGGGDDGFHHYESRLAAATSPYRHVIFIGDSMGATAALLFSHLATEVHAWTPQVDLATSSIRPGQAADWHAALRARILDSVAACSGSIVVHTGSWSHDLDQAKCLPTQPGLKVQIYSVDSHRLALALDRRGKLEKIVRGAVLGALGLANKDALRVANLF